MKSIKDLDVKYVLSPMDQKEIAAGVDACACNVIVGNTWYIAGRLIIIIENPEPEAIA